MTPRRWLERLMALGRRRRLDRELADEMHAHLELCERDAMAEGLSPAEARRVAHVRFGGMVRVQEDHRDRRSARWLEVLLRDVRYGLASLRRAPVFTAAAIGTLALGIGVSAAMFGLMDAVLLKPLPFPHAERIARIWEAPRPGVSNATSTPDFLDWQGRATTFEALAAVRSSPVALTGYGEPVRLAGLAVTAGYFKVFAATPAIGRLFEAGDDQPGAERVAVISHVAWITRFGGDPAILERRATLDGETYRIIGVLPAGVFDRDAIELWKPLVLSPALQTRENHWLDVYGRLRERVTLTQARDEMATVRAALADVLPVNARKWTMVVEPIEGLLVGETLRRSILVGFAAAALVLLIACANVANLLITNGLGRRRELAIRVALGASRGRLAAQLLTEVFVLCALGGMAGTLIAGALVRALRPLASRAIPYTADVRFDLRGVAFVTVIVVIVALAVGTWPALQARFDHVARRLNESSRGSSGRQTRVRRAIVVTEVALSLILISGAGLFFRSLLNLERLDTGARTEGLVTFPIDLPFTVYRTGQQAAQFYDAVADRLRAAPGVTGVAVTTHLPLRWVSNGEGIQVPGASSQVNVRFKRVDAGYFNAFDIPVLEGRGITAADRFGSPPVIVINEALKGRLAQVAHLADPVGQIVSLTAPDYVDKNGSVIDARIVGVIRSERVDVPWRSDPPVAYVPVAQVPAASVKFVVRTAGDQQGLAPAIRAAVRDVAPDLPIGAFVTMRQVRNDTFADSSRTAWITAILAVLAALLAALGLYGVLAHIVAQQRREIGIRMALGAGVSTVVRQVVRHACGMVAVGLVLGLAATATLTRVLASLLYGVSPLDPLALLLACGAMLGVGLLAAVLPARRAARVQPVTVLREEG